jgi:hypothetical protein
MESPERGGSDPANPDNISDLAKALQEIAALPGKIREDFEDLDRIQEATRHAWRVRFPGIPYCDLAFNDWMAAQGFTRLQIRRMPENEIMQLPKRLLELLTCERSLEHGADPRTTGGAAADCTTPAKQPTGEMRVAAGGKRFRVALSFPGERREFLARVAENLAERLGRDKVFYDRYYEAELARPNLDTYLQSIYHAQSDLIGVFFCADYERKEWCGLEWRAIRDLVKKGLGPAIMPFRFDDTPIPGIFSIDGYIDIGNRSAAEVASLVLHRLNTNDQQNGSH